MFLTSRWFPLVFGLLQTARYFALVGYDYWAAAQNESRFDVTAFVRRDLDRPLFESAGWCGAYVQYAFGQSAVFGIDLPAYPVAMLLQASITRQATCLDTLTSPRGQIVAGLCVLPVWYLVGLSARRIALRRWRRRVIGRIPRAILSLGWVPLVLGILALLMSLVGAFVSGAGQSVRMAGIAFWMLYWAGLASERLRAWPYTCIEGMVERLTGNGLSREVRP